ncbi:OLC1v1007345C1 [Oldenlandia corymbosa var. corymbosa]|uniref:OLC1v1007345C1 n=1 Tax=Oldenlandia corymbosa var. corymbosa TaxID=529605 RepID=A0AAV1DJF4_OLDCO|nr:OLC1v1007345C1 [Oldenlandia corymbosa var. corymbosa]
MMGFKKVYNVLLEIFPEVDSRALRAVAIEHQKDADAAVEVVLTEVIPFLAERSAISVSSSKNMVTAQPPKATTVFADEPPSTSNAFSVDNVKYQEEEQHVPLHAASADQQTFHDAKDDLDELGQERRLSDNLDKECDERSGNLDSGDNINSCSSSAVLIHENGAIADNDEVTGDAACVESADEVSQARESIDGCDVLSQLNVKPLEDENVNPSQLLDYCLDAKAIRAENFEEENSLLKDEHSLLISEPSDLPISDLNKEFDGPVDSMLTTESSIELVDVVSDSGLNTVVTRSGQICNIDLLEDIIADARNNKKTLLSAVEIVLDLMKDVEAQEKAAEKAKEDAANSGVDIFKRVEDLKQMLQHAKEANDMHAGEVYGEKAILATEVKELQTRLLCISDERDRSLKIFDEIRQNLEERLDEAENVIKVAEKEKLEREAAALTALKDQEVIMEKVVQEANLLKEEAEANAKLREFLMDRGRVVDELQGEISVICTDMRLLKEKIDERVPLSKSVTSSVISSFGANSVLSRSAANSVMSGEQAEPVTNHVDLSETLKNMDDNSSLDGQFVGEDETADVFKDVDKEFSGDGWEIFDSLDTYIA